MKKILLSVLASTFLIGSSAYAIELALPGQDTIVVQQATYGVFGGACTCDATPKVSAVCNGLVKCSIDVAIDNLCTPPKCSGTRNLLVNYSCGLVGEIAAGADGTVVTLACPTDKHKVGSELKHSNSRSD